MTTKQKHVLEGFRSDTAAIPTARQLADRLETSKFRSGAYSYDEVYSQLRALEKKGLVARKEGQRALHWQITPAGVEALA